MRVDIEGRHHCIRNLDAGRVAGRDQVDLKES
jgi:hypothetical protein